MFVLLLSFTILLAVHLVSGIPKGVRSTEWLKYSELQSLGATCKNIDTCTTPRDADALDVFTCECKISCARYRTCCIDSLYRDTRPSSISKETCQLAFGAGINVFMITKCDPNWKGDPIIIDNCESKRQNFSDPVGTVPVTNLETSTTYKNYFCAICNDDDRYSTLWNIHIEGNLYIEKNSTDEDSIRGLLYEDVMDAWGIWETGQNGQRLFNSVIMEFRIPESMISIVKLCRPDLKRECAPDWKDEQIMKKCEAYMAAVYILSMTEWGMKDVGYYNPHCAICNHVSNISDVCEHRSVPYGVKPPLSFAMLLDVNGSDGDKVGEVNQCSSSEVHDPFFKTCRALVCALPGYTIKDGKCTKI